MKRHKWEKSGHAYKHQKQCIKCPCIKDTSIMQVTRYLFKGEVLLVAPECTEEDVKYCIVGNPKVPLSERGSVRRRDLSGPLTREQAQKQVEIGWPGYVYVRITKHPFKPKL